MDLKRAALVISLIALSACGDKDAKDDKAKQAVKEVITREFQYYDSAKQKLGAAEKQEQQRREQEKQLE
jgi:ABC-type oligopeptide transport system substrate-binding subunit